MDKNGTKTWLIEVGAKAILEKGYHAAGLQEILKEAAVPKGSFYHYFESKEDFCISIIDHYIAEYTQRCLSGLLMHATPAKERLLIFFTKEREYYLAQQCYEGCLVVKLITEMSQASAPIRLKLQEGIESWVKALAACIKDGVDAEEFSVPKSPEIMAEYIHSTWIGALVRMQVSQSIQPLDIFMEFLSQQISS